MDDRMKELDTVQPINPFSNDFIEYLEAMLDLEKTLKITVVLQKEADGHIYISEFKLDAEEQKTQEEAYSHGR